MKIQSNGLNADQVRLKTIKKEVKKTEEAKDPIRELKGETDPRLNSLKEEFLKIQTALSREQTLVSGLEFFKDFLKNQTTLADTAIDQLVEKTLFRNEKVLAPYVDILMQAPHDDTAFNRVLTQSYENLKSWEKNLSAFEVTRQNLLASSNNDQQLDILLKDLSHHTKDTVSYVLERQKVIDLLD